MNFVKFNVRGKKNLHCSSCSRFYKTEIEIYPEIYPKLITVRYTWVNTFFVKKISSCQKEKNIRFHLKKWRCPWDLQNQAKNDYHHIVLQYWYLLLVKSFSKILNNNGDIHVLIYINIYDQKIYKRFIKS